MEEILKNKYSFRPQLNNRCSDFYRFENKEFHYRIHIKTNWLRKLEVIDVRPIPKYLKFAEDLYYKSENELFEYLDDEYLEENKLLINNCKRE